MKKIMSNLPRDLAEEVLCRIPFKSLRSVRSTCKKWNILSKDRRFAKRHIGQAKVAEAKETMVVMMKDYRVFLMGVNLSNNNNVESCIKREAKLIGPYDSDEIDVCEVFNCDGLLLCVMKGNSTLVVWNPYWGQTRWIVPTHNFQIQDKYSYALGYDKSSKSHKILRFIDLRRPDFVEFKIYDFNSDSWMFLDLSRYDWSIEHYHCGLTLKGNTYWFATENSLQSEFDGSFLVCFDFTRETFGPRLLLPFDDACLSDTVSLSSVREEQLVVLFQPWDTLRMEIWVSTKIEPNAVSWNSKVLLTANIKQLIHPQFQFLKAMSFFIDEEKKVVVVFDQDDISNPTRNVAYIIGVDGSLREVDVGDTQYELCTPIVCSYIPSLVQLV